MDNQRSSMHYWILDVSSFIKKSLADALGLKGPPITLRIQTLGQQMTEQKNHEVVEFTIDNPNASMLMKAATIQSFCTQIHTFDPDTWKQFDTIDMACPRVTGKVDISLLIGVDYLGDIYAKDDVKPVKDIPRLVYTRFGHCMMGTSTAKQGQKQLDNATVMHTVSVFTGKSTIEHDLTKLWSLEAMGISDSQNETLTFAETQATVHFSPKSHCIII